MRYKTLQFSLLLIAMTTATLSLHAQQATAPAASTPPAPAPAANTATPTPAPVAQSTAPSSAPAQPSDETLKKAKKLGLKAETHNGETMYCWEDASSGTRFTTKKCASADQLNELITMREAAKDDMRRSMTGTSSR